MEVYDGLQTIVNGILGEPRREGYGSGGWLEYNCPQCTEENFGEPDDKYNLALNFMEGYCHCWKCSYSARVSRLVKHYGSMDDFSRYKDELSRIKEQYYYQIQSGEFVLNDDPVEIEPLKLPDCHDVYDGTNDGNKALEYLYGRGVDDYLIQKYSIKYIGNEWGNPFRNMVIIPSYDEFGELNYFSGRDFTGRKSYNKKNADVPKTEIVFNSQFLNYYEPVTIVEGPFDHIVVPNSIPLLGKSLKAEDAVYRLLTQKCKDRINIMLDNDAERTMMQLYKLLNSGILSDRVYIINCPQDMDPSDIYKYYGRKGMMKFLSTAHRLDGLQLAKL